MEKNDLKTGMIIIDRGGKRGVVIEDSNIGNYIAYMDGGWNPFEYFENNMKHKRGAGRDIMYIYNPSDTYLNLENVNKIYFITNNTLLYCRGEKAEDERGDGG
jgi:hypothetical protein